MMSKRRSKEIHFTEHGVCHYDSGMYDDSVEEVKQLNDEYYAKEKEAIPQILEDGYIEFPILFETHGEPIWSSCYLPPNFVPSNSEGFRERFGMDFNIYIPSYQRADTSYTAKTLKEFGIENYYICVDPSQYEAYKEAHGIEHIIIRDPSFKSEEKVDLISSVQCPDYLHGASGVFNSLLYISKSLGEDLYFTMDDDFMNFGIKAKKRTKKAMEATVYDKDDYYRVSKLDPETFNLKEYLRDFGDFYQKVRNRGMMAGEKYGLVFHRSFYPLVTGSRSYSFYLSNNRTQIDHRGQQNNDIITSLEMSKNGFVNITLQIHRPEEEQLTFIRDLEH